jgi:putative NADH-flavin reductase
MNITVIGASAGIGLETVKRALERNHNVTTLSRFVQTFFALEQVTRAKGLKEIVSSVYDLVLLAVKLGNKCLYIFTVSLNLIRVCVIFS